MSKFPSVFAEKAGKMSSHSLKVVFFSVVFSAAIESRAAAGPVQIFFTDFDGETPAGLTGVTSTSDVWGFAADGFSESMLHNETGGNPLDRRDAGIAGQATVLTLTGLAEHTHVEVNFLLAVIDSWDNGGGCEKGNDFFNVTADGASLIHDSFGNACGEGTYAGPDGSELGTLQHRGFAGLFADRAFNLGMDPRLLFAHTGSTLTLMFFADGAGWQGGIDESWGMDNLEVILYTSDLTPVPEPASLLLVGGALLGGARRLRRTRQQRAA
jgi:hypothetical protein